jgi:broad specificity phosphatase PhoE
MEQAHAVAARLRAEPIAAVYSSPLLRCLQTARVIAEPFGYLVCIEARLRERLNWGDAPGQSREAFLADWNASTTNRDYVPQGGESSRATGLPMQAALQELVAQFPEQGVVCVTHGGAIADWLLTIFDEPFVRANFPHFELVPYAALTRVVTGPAGKFEVSDFATVVYA